MNETLKTLVERRSIRSYTDEVVKKEVLQEIVKAGEYSASGMGRQAGKMVVITNKETRNYLSKLNGAVMGNDNDPFYGAPVVIVVFADTNIRTYLYDGSLIMGNLMNAAYSLGVDSCWIHRAKEVFQSPEGKELMKKWGIPENYEGIGNCILGYHKGDFPTPKDRKEDFTIYVD